MHCDVGNVHRIFRRHSVMIHFHLLSRNGVGHMLNVCQQKRKLRKMQQLHAGNINCLVNLVFVYIIFSFDHPNQSIQSHYIQMWPKLPLCVLFFFFKMFFLVNDEFITHRDCLWKYVDDECFYNKLPDDMQVKACATCDSDGCNGMLKYNSEAVLTKPYKCLSVLLSCSLWIRYRLFRI